MDKILIFAIASAVVSLVYGAVLIFNVLKKPQGDEKMISISKAIREGANAYLKRQNGIILIVGIIVAVLIIIGMIATSVPLLLLR